MRILSFLTAAVVVLFGFAGELSAGTSTRVTSRTYDQLDRLESETVALESGATATVSYTYYNDGRRRTVTDAYGRVTFYEYDGRGNLVRVTANQGLPDEHATSFEYWPDDLLRTITRPNGVVTWYGYDRADRLTSIVVRLGPSELASYAYTYDANGNRLTQVETNGGPPETTTYTYDDLNRLSTVGYPDGTSASYEYDAVGNRTREIVRNGSTVVSDKTAVFDPINRLTSITDEVDPSGSATLTWDDNGNLLSKETLAGVESYTYDAADHLVETSLGSSITSRFAFDPFGRRHLKIGLEGVRQYLYDETSTLHEADEAGLEVATYSYGADRLLSFVRHNEPRRFYDLDALGSPVVLSDSSGSVIARYHLDAWGRYRVPLELDASRNRFGFTGYLFDQETSLYYAKARFYDPEIGRFTSQDSMLGQVDEPPSLHRYAYGFANPLRYVDPDGHESVLPHLAELDKPGRIANWKQEVFRRNPSRFADAITDEEGTYLDQFRVQKLHPSRLNEVHIKEARTLFGDNKDALDQYTNYQARSQLITRFALTDPRIAAYLGELYRTSRDLDPVHFVGERVHQIATGEEAFTDQDTGRARPAIELALAYTLGKIANFVVGKAVEPGPFDTRISARTASGETAEGTSQIGRGQQVYREGEGLFVRGQQGEFVYAEGRLGDVAAPRDFRAQAKLSGRLPGDQAGHALAARFGFTGKEPNLVPMAPQLNQSSYKALENHLARLKTRARRQDGGLGRSWPEHAASGPLCGGLHCRREARDSRVRQSGAEAAMMTRLVTPADLAAENDIYLRLGRVLLEMIHPEHSDQWQEILLHVEHVALSDAPDAYVMETTVVLHGSTRLPLVARPEILSLAQELDRLCKEQSGKAWRAFDYRVFRDDRGPGFQCRYTYADPTH